MEFESPSFGVYTRKYQDLRSPDITQNGPMLVPQPSWHKEVFQDPLLENKGTEKDVSNRTFRRPS